MLVAPVPQLNWHQINSFLPLVHPACSVVYCRSENENNNEIYLEKKNYRKGTKKVSENNRMKTHTKAYLQNKKKQNKNKNKSSQRPHASVKKNLVLVRSSYPNQH